ncbi:MAG: hypothetical protein WD749_10585 [Phycisphaerales bacterium]
MRTSKPVPAFLLTVLAAAAGAQAQHWVRFYDGPVRLNDYGNGVALGPAGTVAITGRSSGLGTGADFATVKYDAAGNQLWAARYTGPGNEIDQGELVGMDAAGNVYVTGQSWGGYRPAGGEWDYVTIKYDGATGQALWTRRYDGPGNWSDTVLGMKVDAAGNVHLCGFAFKELDIFGRYATHFHVMKYDTAGTVAWEHLLDGPVHLGAGARAVALDAAGNVYATGQYNGGDGFNNDDNIMTVKIGPAGNLIYTATWSSTAFNTGWDDGLAVAADADGNALVAGRIMSDDLEEHVNAVVLKYGPTGSLLWATSSQLDNSDAPGSITADAAGNVYVGGGASTQTDDLGMLWSLSPQGTTRWREFFDQPGEWDQNWIVDVRVGPEGNIYGLGDIQYDDGYFPTVYVNTPAGAKVSEARHDVGSGNSTTNGFDIAPDGSIAIGGWRHMPLTLVDYFTVRIPGGGGPPACYANCDGSTAAPVLNVADFSCFLQRYAAGEAYANCDQSTAPPVLNVADFSCFLQRYAAGCP